jgi:hypothetical protein
MWRWTSNCKASTHSERTGTGHCWALEEFGRSPGTEDALPSLNCVRDQARKNIEEETNKNKKQTPWPLVR